MHAVPFMLGALCFLAIAYRYYSGFLAAKVAVLDDTRITPAHELRDGHNYTPMSKWVLFGHHFAAITGAGPLIGPTLAAQFGFLPGFLWLLIGVTLGGAAHDFLILFASVRRKGKSLAEIARLEVGPTAGVAAAVAILFIVVVALAGLGLAVVNALRDSPWAMFTIVASIPLAMAMGVYTERIRKNGVREATIFGVVLLVAAVVYGRVAAESSWAGWLTFDKDQLTVLLAIYGFGASVLPVWLLLCPRDYLSSFMKIGTIGFLIAGVLIVNPIIHMPMVSEYAQGGGPIIPGKLYPFLFITIACGAISGFHALIASGTTPKMIDRESHIRPIGYGAMLMEGLVGITTLLAACALIPADYYAINVEAGHFAQLGMDPVNLSVLSQQVGEALEGRTGGAVSLAVGMAQIFSGIPGLAGLMSYWYHFAIMFEAMFILTTIDAGTRVARFLVQESLGKFYKPFENTSSAWSAAIASLLVVCSWGYFIHTGTISTLWPMFGIANQLLASVALAVAATLIINLGRARYAWVALVPLAFVAVTTATAGIQSILYNFLPRGDMQGYINSAVTALMIACLAVVLVCGVRRWFQALWPSKSNAPLDPQAA